MLLTASLLAATAPALDCSLMLPVAPDQAAARRIAEAVLRNVPASQRVRAAIAGGRSYELVVMPDEADPRLWLAFQTPRLPPSTRADRDRNVVVLVAPGHGLQFRIDRCTGAISRLSYSR